VSGSESRTVLDQSPPEFTGRVALVTGAAGAGCGQAIARRLAAGGATVVVTDSHERRTNEVARAIAKDHPGTKVIGEVLDIGEPEQVTELVARLSSDMEPISLLVNNAAINIMGSIIERSIADWRHMMAVNLDGPFLLSRLVMRALRDVHMKGCIVNVSSIAATAGGGGLEAAYAISKAGLNALTRCCAYEGGPLGIRVNAIAMHAVEGTRFVDRHADLIKPGVLGHLVHVSEVADAVAFLASDRARSITGEILQVTAGMFP